MSQGVHLVNKYRHDNKKTTRSWKDLHCKTRTAKRKASPEKKTPIKRRRVAEQAGPSTSSDVVKGVKRKVEQDGEGTTNQAKKAKLLDHMSGDKEQASSSLDTGKDDGSKTGSDVPRVRIIDFGLSCFVKQRSLYRIFYDTPLHTPPEWYRRSWYRCGPTTVWQMGVVLYEVLHARDFNTERFLRKKLSIKERLSTTPNPGGAPASPLAEISLNR
ncbi:vomeronasal 2 receptor [Sarotherodon galilaeus]